MDRSLIHVTQRPTGTDERCAVMPLLAATRFDGADGNESIQRALLLTTLRRTTFPTRWEPAARDIPVQTLFCAGFRAIARPYQ